MANRRTSRRVILLLAVTSFAGLVFYQLAAVEPVKVLSSRLEHSAGGVAVAGTVTNSGPDAELNLEISWYDRNGARVGSERVRVGRLRRGEERPFHTAVRPAEQAADFTIAVDRGHNPYGN